MEEKPLIIPVEGSQSPWSSLKDLNCLMLSRLENHGYNKFSSPGYFSSGMGSHTAPKVSLKVHSWALIFPL